MIQRLSRVTEKRGSKTNSGRRSQRVESRENIEQEKSEKSSKVFSLMEEVYSRAQ